jgi:integrase
LLKVASPEEPAMMHLGLDAPLGLGDVRALRVEHDKGGHLEIVNPKTEPYEVPVSSRLRDARDALEPNGGFYFAREYKRPMGGDGRSDGVRPLRGPLRPRTCRARARVFGITIHSLRHTGATRASRTVKLRVAQQLGGWKNLKQLARYDHPDDPEMIRRLRPSVT